MMRVLPLLMSLAQVGQAGAKWRNFVILTLCVVPRRRRLRIGEIQPLIVSWKLELLSHMVL
ncbi:hypothetical protein D3C78_1879840 [compost metagenome]